MSQLNYEDLVGTKVHDVELGTGTIEAIDHNSIVVEFQRKIGLRSFFFPNAFLSKRLVHSNIDIQKIIMGMDYVEEIYDDEELDEDSLENEPEEVHLVPDYSNPVNIDDLLTEFKKGITNQPLFQIPLRKTLEAVEETFVDLYLKFLYSIVMDEVPEEVISQAISVLHKQYYPLLAFAIMNERSEANNKISKYIYKDSDEIDSASSFCNFYLKVHSMIEDSKYGYASYEIDGNILKEKFIGNELYHIIRKQQSDDSINLSKKLMIKPNWIFELRNDIDIEEHYKLNSSRFNETFNTVFENYKNECIYGNIDLNDFTYYDMLKVLSAFKVISMYEIEKMFMQYFNDIPIKTISKKINKFIKFVSKLSNVEESKVELILDLFSSNKKIVSIDNELIYFHKYNNSIILFIYNLYKDNLPISFEKIIWLRGNLNYLTPISKIREKIMLDNIYKCFIKMPNVLVKTNVKYHYEDSYKITAEYDVVIYDTDTKQLLLIECKWYNLNGRGKGRYNTDKKIYDSLEYRTKKNAYVHTNTLEFMYKVFGDTYQVKEIKELMVLDKYIGDIPIDDVIDYETLKINTDKCDNLNEFINEINNKTSNEKGYNNLGVVISVGPYKVWLLDMYYNG